jgi:hypothetical protein
VRFRRYLLACAVAVACMAVTDNAGAYVFWTTRDGGNEEADKVRRANPDGCGVNRALLGDSPRVNS